MHLISCFSFDPTFKEELQLLSSSKENMARIIG